MEFFASCPAGFESLLAEELRVLGTPRVRPLHGQVAFEGELQAAYRVCLWSRLASRVVAVLGRIPARDANELYEGVYQIAWEEELRRTARISIDAHGTNASLRNTRFTALRTKDAIADRMAEMLGVRLAFDPRNADISVVVRLSKERATVGIELAGEPLFHRDGQRTPEREALRPDYAAALLAAGAWQRMSKASAPTLLVGGGGASDVLAEAKAMLSDRAPNLLRSHWGFEAWQRHDEPAWFALLDEADACAEVGATKLAAITPAVDDAADTTPADRDPAATTPVVANSSATTPVVANSSATTLAIQLINLSSSRVERLQTFSDDVLLCYDARDAEDVASSARTLAQLRAQVASLPQGSHVAILGRNTALASALGAQPNFFEKVFLGGDEGRLYAFDLVQEVQQTSLLELKAGGQVSVELPASEQFARRLEKMWRLRRKWARREDVGAYRIYDADLPDYAVSLDRFEPSALLDEKSYGGSGGGPWVVLSEYAAPKEVDPALARTRLMDALAIAAPVLGVAPENVFVRQRLRGRGGSQYAERQGQKRDAQENRKGDLAHKKGMLTLSVGTHLVDEGGLTFELNFSAGLDVGLFLDTRDVRARIREMAKATAGSKRFLNLFAYTGTASCYAADGGAKHTTTVDLSHTYLSWAKRNMARNGFGGPEHEYVQADVLSWASEQRHTRNRWDLIYLDPPTFSNSSRMKTASFDIQRDHVELLIDVSRLLTRAGSCVFCCNLRDFVPELEKLAKAGVELTDITDQTIPEDFSRNKRIHHCYIMRRA